MTIQSNTGSEVANVSDDMAGLGLEDVSVSDVVIPRLRILHTEGLFQDNLSQAEYPKLRVILLGLVKQRIMWDNEVDEGDRPMCKSPNFEHGFPNSDEDTRKDKRFPWDDSNFDPTNFPADRGVNGQVTLPCAQCNFKEWGQDKKPPRCSEQHTYPLLYCPDDQDETWIPALYTVQRTGVKPSRSYLSAFAQARKPMFTAITEIGLQQQSRGSVRYSVPTFKRIGNTDADMWKEYADTYRTIREFVSQTPRPKDNDSTVEENNNSNVNTTPPPPPPPPPPAAAPPAAAPPAAAPPAAAPPAAAPPAAAPPAAAPPAAAPPAAAPPAAVAAASDEDDLPF